MPANMAVSWITTSMNSVENVYYLFISIGYGTATGVFPVDKGQGKLNNLLMPTVHSLKDSLSRSSKSGKRIRTTGI